VYQNESGARRAFCQMARSSISFATQLLIEMAVRAVPAGISQPIILSVGW